MKPYVIAYNAAVVYIDDGYYEKEPIDTGNIAILQVHLPQLIGARYRGSFGQSALMLRFHFPLGKQHIHFLAQPVYLFMVDVQLIVLLHAGRKVLIAIRITIARYFFHDEFFLICSSEGVGVTRYEASGAAFQWF
jgi:hypothetical protein